MSPKIDNARKILLGLYIFSIPISAAINNILFGFVILFWIIWGDKKETLKLLKNPLVVAFYTLFAIFTISMLWSDDLKQGLLMLKKEMFYLVLPIFMSLVKKEEIDFYLKSFLAAMFISELSSYLIFFKIVPPFLHATQYDPVPFMGATGHISYNPMLVLSIFLLLYFFFRKDNSSLWFKIISAIFILTMTINLFITGGRAGQVAFFFVAIVAFMQFFKANFKTFFISIFAIIAIFFIAYNSSTIFHNRVNLAIHDVKTFKQNPNTSVGMRLANWENSLRLIKKHPLTGAGIGDYKKDLTYYFKKYTPKAAILPQPHNMYLFAWVHSGLFALLALLSIFAIEFKGYRVLNDEYKPIRLILPTLFLIIMFSESYLSVHFTKILFLIFSAFLFKELNFKKLKG